MTEESATENLPKWSLKMKSKTHYMIFHFIAVLILGVLVPINTVHGEGILEGKLDKSKKERVEFEDKIKNIIVDKVKKFIPASHFNIEVAVDLKSAVVKQGRRTSLNLSKLGQVALLKKSKTIRRRRDFLPVCSGCGSH